MYKIIGGDQKEYGPISADVVRQWLAEDRLNAQSLLQKEGSEEWKPLATFPEFADVLSRQLQAHPVAGPSAGWNPFTEQDYDLDIAGCLSRGFQAVTANPVPLIGGAGLYLLIIFTISLLSAIPFIGLLFSAVNFVIGGPMVGGVFYLALAPIRHREPRIEDVFHGIRNSFLNLFLGNLVVGILSGLCLIPAFIVGAILLLPSTINNQPPNLMAVGITGGVGLLCLLPMIFLSICWIFTLPLIVDRSMDFWPAMQTSMRRVRKHWWMVFGLLILASLINMVGMMFCCVGLFFTTPVTMVAMMCAYECIFGQSQPGT
jgi:hypothetical protein